MIEATEVAIGDFDVASGAVEINNRWANPIGHNREEFEPVSLDTFESFIHPDDLEPMRVVLERHLDGETRDFEYEIRMRHRKPALEISPSLTYASLTY